MRNFIIHIPSNPCYSTGPCVTVFAYRKLEAENFVGPHVYPTYFHFILCEIASMFGARLSIRSAPSLQNIDLNTGAHNSQLGVCIILTSTAVQRMPAAAGYAGPPGRSERFAGLLLRITRATQRFARRVRIQQRRRRAAGTTPTAWDDDRARLLKHVQAHVATLPRRLGLTQNGHAETSRHAPESHLGSSALPPYTPQRDYELMIELTQVCEFCRPNLVEYRTPLLPIPICATADRPDH